MTPPPLLLDARDVVRRFAADAGDATVLDGIDLEIAEGDYVALTGPSGSGKTTLLSCLSGLDQPSSGTIRFAGEDLSLLDDRRLAHLRRTTVGFVFQRTDLLDELLVLDNILLPAHGRRGRIPADVRTHTVRLMERLDIAHLAGRRPHELSGGQRQRVGICRALVNRPRILFADEPTGALHSDSVREVLSVFDDLNAAGTTLVVVTHDPVVARRARRRCHLVDGRLVPSPELTAAADG